MHVLHHVPYISCYVIICYPCECRVDACSSREALHRADCVGELVIFAVGECRVDAWGSLSSSQLVSVVSMPPSAVEH
jgi:hypothetical protein